MGAAFFYHLTRDRLEDTLPMLAGKALGAGMRVGVLARDRARLEALDAQLWLPADSFLPHGIAGGPHDADQPILLATDPDWRNGATCVMAVDGAEVAPEAVTALARTCILFDGTDDGAVTQARAQWRALTGAGCEAVYWSQETGK
ncbi:MAG: DNA polymerase III subunit chi, partial [Shimia sp.]